MDGLIEVALPLSHTFRTRHTYLYYLYLSAPAHSLLSSYCSLWRTEPNVRTVKLNETYAINSVRTEQNIRTRRSGVPAIACFYCRTRHTYVYLLYLSAPAHSLMSSYCSLWRTERNVRTVKLNETYAINSVTTEQNIRTRRSGGVPAVACF